MHCDIMFINKQPFLVSITHPLGIVLVGCVDNVTTPVLRQSLKRMFGTIGSRRISIAKFTSDNERGASLHLSIAAPFNDMNAMGVEVIAVGPGQHDHIIERMIRHLKETIRCTIFSLPYLLPDIVMPYLVTASAKKLLLFPYTTLFRSCYHIYMCTYVRTCRITYMYIFVTIFATILLQTYLDRIKWSDTPRSEDVV